MNFTRAGLVGLGLLVLAGDLHAQVVIGTPGGYYNRRFSISLGAPGYSSPYYYGGPSFSGISIYSVQPQVIYSTSPIVVRPPAPQQPLLPPEPPVVNNIRDEDFPDKIIIRPRNQQVRNDPAPRIPEPMIDDRPLPGAPAGEFRPLRPEERARVQPEEARRPGPQVPEQREADPRAEHARQINLGRFAFSGREYARAERRFQEAVRVVPKEPIGYFLLAQAQFALGKFREASASIHAGLRIDPEWPTLKFRARDLYAENLTDYADHLKAIEEALLKNQNDAVLLFVYAYQLWFEGRKDEARPLLRRASRLVMSPFFIELFLLAQPGGPVTQGL